MFQQKSEQQAAQHRREEKRMMGELNRLRDENQELAVALRSTADKLGEVSRLKVAQQQKAGRAGGTPTQPS